MSTESQTDIIQTATVAIFSSDMAQMIVVVNKKLRRILPPWWKFNPLQDTNILDTVFREAREEISLALFPWTGLFLNKVGNPIIDPDPVEVERFTFVHDRSTEGEDHLFFFRLHEMVCGPLRGEVQGYFFTRAQIEQETSYKEWAIYSVLFPRMKGLILSVMK